MKKLITILMLFNLFFICYSQQISDSVILGDWCYYAPPDELGKTDSVYSEIYFSGSYSQAYTTSIGITPPANYYLQNDSIFIKSYTSNQSLPHFAAKIKYTNYGLQFINDSINFRLVKIDKADYKLSEHISNQNLIEELRQRRDLHSLVRMDIDNYYASWYKRRQILMGLKTNKTDVEYVIDWIQKVYIDSENSNYTERIFFQKLIDDIKYE